MITSSFVSWLVLGSCVVGLNRQASGYKQIGRPSRTCSQPGRVPHGLETHFRTPSTNRTRPPVVCRLPDSASQSILRRNFWHTEKFSCIEPVTTKLTLTVWCRKPCECQACQKHRHKNLRLERPTDCISRRLSWQCEIKIDTSELVQSESSNDLSVWSPMKRKGARQRFSLGYCLELAQTSDNRTRRSLHPPLNVPLPMCVAPFCGHATPFIPQRFFTQTDIFCHNPGARVTHGDGTMTHGTSPQHIPCDLSWKDTPSPLNWCFPCYISWQDWQLISFQRCSGSSTHLTNGTHLRRYSVAVTDCLVKANRPHVFWFAKYRQEDIERVVQHHVQSYLVKPTCRKNVQRVVTVLQN